MSEITSSNRPPAGRLAVQYDRGSNESLSVTIVGAVADVLGAEVTELEPLHYTVHTDALDRLFAPRANGPRSAGSVSFEYQGCRVEVSADGRIVVDESGAGDDG